MENDVEPKKWEVGWLGGCCLGHQQQPAGRQ